MPPHKFLSKNPFRTNPIPRLILLALAVFPLFYLNEFIVHFEAYFTGNIINQVIIGNWAAVIGSISLFAAFLIPLSYRRKADWAEYGLATAFFVSLFVEMYGVPLTILFASKYFYSPQIALPQNVAAFNLFGFSFAMDLAMAYGAVLMAIGAALILVGWVNLYKAAKKDRLVTTVIYSYSRHPQYLGFILIIFGWLVGWPTILTLIFAPILIYKYIRVCQAEEKEMEKFGDYRRYKQKVPFFI
ncbi:MAG: methyltransferase family protein [Candidatus Aenigmatarchaeota archaeon]